MTQLLLIDGDNLLAKNMAIFEDLETSDGIRIGGLYGFIQSLKSVVWKFREYSAVVVWDGGRAAWRMALHPEYKAKRKTEEPEDPEGFVSRSDQAALARDLLKDLGFHSIHLSGVEADDVIAYLARAAPKAVVYSTDKDFYQLLCKETVTVVRRVKGEEQQITYLNFHEEVKGSRTPQHYRFEQAMCGDKGDNIKGVYRVGIVTAQAILDHVAQDYPDDVLLPWRRNLPLIHAACRDSPKRAWRRVVEQWGEFRTSLLLIDLWSNRLLSFEHIDAIVSEPGEPKQIDRKELLRKLARFEFDNEDLMEAFFPIFENRRRYIDANAIAKELSFAEEAYTV